MSNFKKTKKESLSTVEIIEPKKSHISIKDKDVCLEKCENTYYCPSRVFEWEDEKIKVSFKRCMECGACPWGCPYDNISWTYPPGGYGVNYKI
jgi:ferredoxin like protein